MINTSNSMDMKTTTNQPKIEVLSPTFLLGVQINHTRSHDLPVTGLVIRPKNRHLGKNVPLATPNNRHSTTMTDPMTVTDQMLTNMEDLRTTNQAMPTVASHLRCVTTEVSMSSSMAVKRDPIGCSKTSRRDHTNTTQHQHYQQAAHRIHLP
jgi:hypothetical protein